MAKTISNFLVGVGFDLDKKSADGVASGIDSIKSKALQLGALVAGAFGIKALTTDFANAKDDLGKFAEVFGGSADDISAFGNALRLEGGTLEGFMSQLASLEQFRAGLATGDTGFLEAAGRAGLDTRALIEAETATEGFLTLADQFQKLSRKQRISAAQAIGLDEASIRLLSKGRNAIEEVVEAQRIMRPVTDEMTDAAAEFNDQMQDMGTNIGGVADQISVKLLPQINNVLAGMNSWIAANRELLDTGVLNFLGEAAIDASRFASQAVLNEETIEGAGRKTAEVLGFFGNEEAQRAVLITEALGQVNQAPITIPSGDIFEQLLFPGRSTGQAQPSIQRSQPIQIKSQLILDGKVIDERVQNIVGEMADQAVQDLQSSEAG